MVSVNAIQGTLIADNAVTSVHIATNAVSGTLIADNAVTATHIAQNTITVTQLADDAVEADKIADGVITTNHLNKAMISSQTEVAVATGDFILLGDTSDSNNLKKAPISSILAGTLTTAAQTNITSLGTLTALTGGTGDFNWDSGTLFVDSSANNVGVGATSLQSWAKLEVAGTAGAQTGAKQALYVRAPSTTANEGVGIRMSAASGSNEAVGIIGMVNNASGNSGSMTFHTYNGGADIPEAMRINNTGNVGIGTTSPATTLHLDASGGAVMRLQRTSSNASNKLELSHDGTDGTITSTNDLILSATNVGIGTTNPSTPLHIKGAGDAYVTIEAGGTDGNCGLLFDNSSSTQKGSFLYDTDDNILKFEVNSAERMRIDSSGRVGINRTPAISNSKLEVGGADNVPLINVEASGATAGFGIGSSKGKFYYGTSEACSFAVGDFYAGNLRLNGTSSNSQIEAGNVHFKVGAGIWMSGSSSLDLQLQVPVTGVGVTTAAKLDAPTGDWYTNDGSVSSLSDSRLKKDITTLTDGMNIVKQLRPVTFKYDDSSLEEDGSKALGAANDTTRYGFVAQEVETVAPQYVVSKEGKVKGETVSDLKSLSQTRMIPMLVKAIQELEARIKTLEG